MQVRGVGVIADAAQHLGVELPELAAGDDADQAALEEPAQLRGHLVGQWTLGRGQRVVEIEHHQPVCVAAVFNSHRSAYLLFLDPRARAHVAVRGHYVLGSATIIRYNS